MQNTARINDGYLGRKWINFRMFDGGPILAVAVSIAYLLWLNPLLPPTENQTAADFWNASLDIYYEIMCFLKPFATLYAINIATFLGGWRIIEDFVLSFGIQPAGMPRNILWHIENNQLHIYHISAYADPNLYADLRTQTHISYNLNDIKCITTKKSQYTGNIAIVIQGTPQITNGVEDIYDLLITKWHLRFGKCWIWGTPEQVDAALRLLPDSIDEEIPIAEP